MECTKFKLISSFPKMCNCQSFAYRTCRNNMYGYWSKTHCNLAWIPTLNGDTLIRHAQHLTCFWIDCKFDFKTYTQHTVTYTIQMQYTETYKSSFQNISPKTRTMAYIIKQYSCTFLTRVRILLAEFRGRVLADDRVCCRRRQNG